MESIEFLVLFAILFVAVLYSSVGHGGGSGYLAVMAFLSIPPNVTRPTALALNIFVSLIATIQFYRRGYFSWRVFLPFAAASIPFAFVGGSIDLPVSYYKPFLGAVLLFAAFRLAWKFGNGGDRTQTGDGSPVSRPLYLALLIGAAIGLVSGMIGVGGGIFLTPILFLTNWTEPKQAAGISAMFILVNSVSGLLGNFRNASNLPGEVVLWIAVAVAGGIIGSTLGSKYFNSIALRRVLAAVLVIAGLKLFFV